MEGSLMRRLVVASIGACVALVAIGTAIAVASSATLRVKKNVHVTNAPTASFAVKAVNTHEAVAVGATGYAVYTFQGETTHHLICKKTNSAATNCWAFWPPVSVSSARGLSKQAGIKGKLGTFRNHGTLQLTLGGQPLYYFTPDLQSGNKGRATGDELKSYGSIWHIVKAHVGGTTGSGSPGTGGSGSPPTWG
jgi:predicted lipoprotein with Yx(FWY)xxD motif